MKSFISLEEAIEILNENVKTMEVEEVQLIDAIDKVIAEDVYSYLYFKQKWRLEMFYKNRKVLFSYSSS